MFSVGIDVGGTFTDVVLLDERTGEFLPITKVPTTPDDPSKGVILGLKTALKNSNVKISNVKYLSHGSTIAQNMLIERKGAKVGLITTKGFKDVLELRRIDRPDIYDLYQDIPPPLVPRNLRLEVDERVGYQGLLNNLDENEVEIVANQLMDQGVEVIATSLIFSYLYPEHERRIKKVINDLYPQIPVYLSSDINPEFKEYERTSTTVIAAYVGPGLLKYVKNLKEQLKSLGFLRKLYLMQSNGGMEDSEVAMTNPATVLFSGITGGAIFGVSISKLLGYENIITIDMGGTSFDTSLIERGSATLIRESRFYGYAFRLPMIDINVIGAGGGSIAWVDKGGAMRVGPQSAGADPGPACYGMGGKSPTVTDADLILGYLNPDYFLGGEMRLNKELAKEAIKLHISDQLGMDIVEAAQGIFRIVNSNMAEAVKLISTGKGIDPRSFSMLAFGGAGPVHACELARMIEMREVIIPPNPGTGSAMGLLFADIRHDYTQTYLSPLSELDVDKVNNIYARFEASALEILSREGIKEWDLIKSVDLRYLGQDFELNVPVPSGEFSNESLSQLFDIFHKMHEQSYGYKVPGEEVELVNVRLSAIGTIEKPKLRKRNEISKHPPEGSLKGSREVLFMERDVKCPIYDREKLVPGNLIVGPALIEQIDSTTVIPPDFIGKIDCQGFIIIRKKE